MNTTEKAEYSRLIVEANRPGDAVQKFKEEIVRGRTWEKWAEIFATTPKREVGYAFRNPALDIPDIPSNTPVILRFSMTYPEIVKLKKEVEARENALSPLNSRWNSTQRSIASLLQAQTQQQQQYQQVQIGVPTQAKNVYLDLPMRKKGLQKPALYKKMMDLFWKCK